MRSCGKLLFESRQPKKLELEITTGNTSLDACKMMQKSLITLFSILSLLHLLVSALFPLI